MPHAPGHGGPGHGGPAHGGPGYGHDGGYGADAGYDGGYDGGYEQGYDPGYGADPGYGGRSRGGPLPGQGGPMRPHHGGHDGVLGPRTGTYAVAAIALCPVLVILGLSVPEHDAVLWSTTTAWSIFAAIASVVQLAPALGRSNGRPPQQTWTIGAVATAALVGWWVVLVLPGVSSNVGFLLTMGVAAAVIGCWLSPGRRV